jgi:hypothetical protein
VENKCSTPLSIPEVDEFLESRLSRFLRHVVKRLKLSAAVTCDLCTRYKYQVPPIPNYSQPRTKSITARSICRKQIAFALPFDAKRNMATFPPTSADGNVSYGQGIGNSGTLPPEQPYPSAVVIICSIVLLVSPIVAACCKIRTRRRQPQTVPNTEDEMLQAKTAKELKVKRIALCIQQNSIVSIS